VSDPAAPEPSADFSRGYKEGSDDTARELIGNHERDNKLADAVNRAADLVVWHPAQLRSDLATVTAERDANNECFERALEGYEAERAAHAETRKSLDVLQLAVDAARELLADKRAELARSEARVRELERTSRHPCTPWQPAADPKG
jgi:hypothetical protein